MKVGEYLRKDPGTSYNIVLKANVTNDKRKNLPTSDEIAVLIEENNQTNFNLRDIIISQRNSENSSIFKLVNESLSMYDPFAFPIIHLSGEPGWQHHIYPKIDHSKLNNNTIQKLDDVNTGNEHDSVTKIRYRKEILRI